MFRRIAGRPVLACADLAAQRRRTISRCQRKTVSGLTSSRSLSRRPFGITARRVAMSVRSAQSSLGRRGCRRCRTASWWRRIRISAVFHVSSRRASRSHAASRVVRRNTNRSHMTGDHHGRMTGRATLLARAMDEILGTHSSQTIVSRISLVVCSAAGEQVRWRRAANVSRRGGSDLIIVRPSCLHWPFARFSAVPTLFQRRMPPWRHNDRDGGMPRPRGRLCGRTQQ